MTYEIDSNIMMFELDRAQIVDISVGDELRAKDCPKGQYTWTDHDEQFVENNPGARLFLKVQRESGDEFRGLGIVVIPE